MTDPKQTKPQKYILCKVEKIIFHDDKTGRTIMSVTKDDGKKTRLLGKIGKVEKDYILKAAGSWSKDDKYGWQFNADFIQTISIDPLSDESEYLECTVTFVKVLKEDTGFASVSAERSTGDKIRLSGRLANVRKGSLIGVLGAWKHDEKYGDEFQVTLWEYKTLDEDTTLKLAFDYITSLKNSKTDLPASGMLEKSSTEGDIQSTETDNTTFQLDPDPSNRLSIQSITIPDSVSTINSGTFKNCFNLTEINVSSSNTCFASSEGVLFNKDMTELICYPCAKVGDYTIPESVTDIADWAFCGCLGLSKIIFPKSLAKIGKYAFAYCSGLESVSMPDSLQNIGERSFYDCFALREVMLPNDSVLSPYSFEGCSRAIICMVRNTIDFRVRSICEAYGSLLS